MEYTANGIITLSPFSKLRLSSGVDFILPSKANVSLSSESDDKLSVLIKLEADNDTTAQELAQLELSRICDLLSFYRNISISKSGVTGMTCTRLSKGHTDVIAIATIGLKATANRVFTLGSKSLAELVSNLKQDYSVDFEEVIYKWREAISNEAPTLKYLLLYRLMESMFNKQELIDKWIMSRENSIQIVRDRNKDVTIYTHLRNQIHPKQKTFPSKEIHDNLLKFQTLVHQAIKERYNIQ